LLRAAESAADVGPRDPGNPACYELVAPVRSDKLIAAARRKIIGEAKGVLVSADLAHWLRPRLDRFFTPLN
jgi:hypothetical protein